MVICFLRSIRLRDWFCALASCVWAAHRVYIWVILYVWFCHKAKIQHWQRPSLLCMLTSTGSVINGDKGYDSKDFIEWLRSMGAIHNTPSCETNKEQLKCDWWMYKESHHVECFWQKIKQFRRVATRCDKLAKSFLGFAQLTSALVLLK